MPNERYPAYDGTRLREVIDNKKPGDRFLAIFEDGTAQLSPTAWCTTTALSVAS